MTRAVLPIPQPSPSAMLAGCKAYALKFIKIAVFVGHYRGSIWRAMLASHPVSLPIEIAPQPAAAIWLAKS